MAAMKSSTPHRIWRTTADSPSGEYLEYVPNDASSGGAVVTKKHSAGLPVETRAASGRPVPTSATVPSQRGQETQRSLASTGQRPNSPGAATLKVRVLRPAQVDSWQSSSFDLLSGLQVRDVTDTIPGCVFEELFKDKRTDV